MTERAPVFIIGAARSGTKFLRDLLAASDEVACIPYDVNYVWRDGNENYPDDELPVSSLSDESKRRIRKNLKSLSRQQDGQIMLEKTVSNTLRIPYVAAVYPNAHFVHLVRDGCAVTESSMRQWVKKPDLKALLKKLSQLPTGNMGYIFWFAKNFLSGLYSGRGGGSVWGPRFNGINEVVLEKSLAEVCALQWSKSVLAARQDLESLSSSGSKVSTIRYEDLVTDEQLLVSLLHKLGVQNQESVINRYRSTCNPVTEKHWNSLPNEEQEKIQQIVNNVPHIETRL